MRFSYLFLAVSILAFSVPAQSEAEKQGKEIFEKYQAALGGKENLDQIKTVEIIAEVEAVTGKKKEFTIEDVAGKKRYFCSEGDAGKTELGADGKRSWMRRGGRSDYMNFIPVEATVKYVKLPNEKKDGKEYLVIEEVKPNTRGNAKTYYDPNTFLLARRESVAGFNGSTMTIVTTYSDYRQVGNVLVPFLEIKTNEITGKTTRKILRVRHNIEIDPKIFELDGISPKFPSLDAVQSENRNSTKQPIIFNTNKNSVYKDENGNLITQAEFKERQFGTNYLIETEIVDNRMVGLKLKKGNPETEIGGTPPDFNAILLDNSPIQLSQLKGKVVVLNFWFLACAPCIKEMPELNDLVKEYQSKEVEFIAITHDLKAQVREFLQRRKFDYKQIADAQNIVDSYKNTAFPAHLVLDKDGKILFIQLGYSNKIVEQMKKTIDSALSKS